MGPLFLSALDRVLKLRSWSQLLFLFSRFPGDMKLPGMVSTASKQASSVHDAGFATTSMKLCSNFQIGQTKKNTFGTSRGRRDKKDSLFHLFFLDKFH